jgi:hypothetical protein
MILQHTKHHLQTREIAETEAWEALDWVLDCCSRHEIAEVTLIYGYDWDVGDKSWKDQTVNVASVRAHIRAEEKEKRGYLGYDDLYIKIDDAVQVLFCHHSELHLQYDQDDLPLVKDLSPLLMERIGLRR